MLQWNNKSLVKQLARYLQLPQALLRAVAEPSSIAKMRMEGAVSITARAEEAIFRRENKIGLWE